VAAGLTRGCSSGHRGGCRSTQCLRAAGGRRRKHKARYAAAPIGPTERSRRVRTHPLRSLGSRKLWIAKISSVAEIDPLASKNHIRSGTRSRRPNGQARDTRKGREAVGPTPPGSLSLCMGSGSACKRRDATLLRFAHREGGRSERLALAASRSGRLAGDPKRRRRCVRRAGSQTTACELPRPERGKRRDRLVAALLPCEQLAAGFGPGLEELSGNARAGGAGR
jgi:hypothetical protein